MSHLSSEKKEEMIEKIAKFIVDRGLVEIVELLSEAIMPASYAVGQLSYVTAFPLVYALFGHSGDEYSKLIQLNFKETMPAVIERAKKLKFNKEKLEKKAEKERIEKSSSIFERFKRWFKRK